jgi:hypothetical protein
VTTIVLVSIGILLASAAALMTMFYGGDAYRSSGAKAQADTLMNAGTNMRTAANMYMTAKGRLPDRPSSLASADAIQEMPTVNGIGSTGDAWLDLSVGDGRARPAYAVTGVGDDVCRYVNAGAIGDQAKTILDAPQGLSGCYRRDGRNVYYAMLSDRAVGIPAVTTGVSCANPGTGSAGAAFAQSCYATQTIMAYLGDAKKTQSVLIPSTTEDTYLDAGGGALTSASSPFSSVLYKPQGGRFGDKAYITFYLKEDIFSTFCSYWNRQLRPYGAEPCTNLYDNKIVIHLTPTWTGGG